MKRVNSALGLLCLVASILIAIMIFYMSSLPVEKTQIGPSFPFKPIIYHFVIFFLLGFFLTVFLIKDRKAKYVFWGIAISILYAIFDEVHQLFVPGRCFSIFDIFVDGTGIVSAVILVIFFLKTNLN